VQHELQAEHGNRASRFATNINRDTYISGPSSGTTGSAARSVTHQQFGIVFAKDTHTVFLSYAALNFL